MHYLQPPASAPSSFLSHTISSQIFLSFLIPHFPFSILNLSKPFFFFFEGATIHHHLCSISRTPSIRINFIFLYSFPYNMVYASNWGIFFLLHSLALFCSVSLIYSLLEGRNGILFICGISQHPAQILADIK